MEQQEKDSLRRYTYLSIQKRACAQILFRGREPTWRCQDGSRWGRSLQ